MNVKSSVILLVVYIAVSLAQNDGSYEGPMSMETTDEGSVDDDMPVGYGGTPGEEYTKHLVKNWGDWGHWGHCDKSCGGGYVTRHRECVQVKVEGEGDNIDNCHDGGEQEVRRCNTHCCPVNGGWGEWTHWYSYGQSYNGYYNPRYYRGGHSSYYGGYGYGKYGYQGYQGYQGYGYGAPQRRVRYCNSPMPSCGGSYCHGRNTEYQRTRMHGKNYW